MANKVSGGLLLFNRSNKEDDTPRMLVAHPGGPFFQKRDEGWWSIPKGEPEENEDVFAAALREFQEETGKDAEGPFINLGSIKQKNRKQVYAWAFEGNWEEGSILKCKKITLEYPKGTGRMWTFPEIDRVEMLSPEDAKRKLQEEQRPFVDRLMKLLKKTIAE
ncbi:MAG: NUDIX domain-containing protein [Opitutae bacterium]|nr:NUDIX domain-containing protein [Opitutae bacterium]MBT5910036.1 NUDIX domain-containing protein [Opitutae bacterium]MBT6850916.1 NUDIX domain-containing protein [Opitutae bacterium]MBT7742297.1 NUDIX domain-containing protein [Opitutae bacterium]